LYLGYWIGESAKMRYKTDFRPLEALQAGQWLPVAQAEPADEVPAPPQPQLAAALNTASR
ncbi:MAG: hypothetical protein FGM40_02845, partial [Rhodocyclaceae bacterium]|nr:hypothetical protein [Rhodocyclaceae bacterium]